MAAEFKRGLKRSGEDERSGRLKTATIDENIAEIHRTVLNDSWNKVRYWHLGMRKLSVSLVSCTLTSNEKRVPIHISNALSKQYRRYTLSFSADSIWNLDTPLLSRTVDCNGWIAFKKCKSCFFSWESDGDCFFYE